MTSIYVGNLPFSASEEDIRGLFSQYGAVNSVKLIADRETGRSRGFAFVDMERADARKAIPALNGSEFDGRTLRVDEATDRKKKPGR